MACTSCGKTIPMNQAAIAHAATTRAALPPGQAPAPRFAARALGAWTSRGGGFRRPAGRPGLVFRAGR